MIFDNNLFSKINSEKDKISNELFELMSKLFPICRSITGNGVRKSLSLISEHVPLKICEVPSGTKIYDWIVPDEWNISDAYIKNLAGDKIIDFKEQLKVMDSDEIYYIEIIYNDIKSLVDDMEQWLILIDRALK